MSIENLSNRHRSITVRQVKAARALLGWSQGDLASHSGVSEPTIARLEAEDGILGGRPETAAKIFKALVEGGIAFIADNGGGSGVRLAKPDGSSHRS
jgi:predicted transcriptional regulator